VYHVILVLLLICDESLTFVFSETFLRTFYCVLVSLFVLCFILIVVGISCFEV